MSDLINVQYLVNAIIFSLLGCLAFGVSFKVLDLLSPGNFWHEIIEEHNSALAILVGALSIGLSIIIGAAIKG